MLAPINRIARFFKSPRIALTWSAEFIEDRIRTRLHKNHLEYYAHRQLPLKEGKMEFSGKIGKNLSAEEGYEASKLCAMNALSILKAEVETLENIVRLVRLTGFVCSADVFTDQPQVVNGASELFAEVLGERGVHARLAIGCNELPLGAAVELEVIAEVR